MSSTDFVASATNIGPRAARPRLVTAHVSWVGFFSRVDASHHIRLEELCHSEHALQTNARAPSLPSMKRCLPNTSAFATISLPEGSEPALFPGFLIRLATGSQRVDVETILEHRVLRATLRTGDGDAERVDTPVFGPPRVDAFAALRPGGVLDLLNCARADGLQKALNKS